MENETWDIKMVISQESRGKILKICQYKCEVILIKGERKRLGKCRLTTLPTQKYVSEFFLPIMLLFFILLYVWYGFYSKR